MQCKVDVKNTDMTWSWTYHPCAVVAALNNYLFDLSPSYIVPLLFILTRAQNMTLRTLHPQQPLLCEWLLIKWRAPSWTVWPFSSWPWHLMDCLLLFVLSACLCSVWVTKHLIVISGRWLEQEHGLTYNIPCSLSTLAVLRRHRMTDSRQELQSDMQGGCISNYQYLTALKLHVTPLKRVYKLQDAIVKTDYGGKVCFWSVVDIRSSIAVL